MASAMGFGTRTKRTYYGLLRTIKGKGFEYETVDLVTAHKKRTLQKYIDAYAPGTEHRVVTTRAAHVWQAYPEITKAVRVGTFPELNEEEKKLVDKHIQDGIIPAVKKYRARTGLGLKEAKGQIDKYRESKKNASQPVERREQDEEEESLVHQRH